MIEMSFEEAYLKYRSRIERYIQYQYGYSLQDAEEIASDFFSILLQKWKLFESHQESGVVKFLYRTARNKSLERLKAQKKQPVILSIDDPNVICGENEPIYADPDGEKNEYLARVEQIKGELTENERATFEYIVEKENDFRETAKFLNTNELNIRVRWCRIRKKIEKIIEHKKFSKNVTK